MPTPGINKNLIDNKNMIYSVQFRPVLFSDVGKIFVETQEREGKNSLLYLSVENPFN